MLGAFPVGDLHVRIVPNGLGDPAFEIVDHQPVGNASEKRQRIAMGKRA